MNSSKCVNDSHLMLNKEELNIKPVKRRITNINYNYKKEDILNKLKKPRRKA